MSQACAEFHYIDTYPELVGFCERAILSPWIAVDTEFLREKTYYPKFCLLQIATDSVVACIDPLALANLEPLDRLLFNPQVCKVFHAARQDLEVFYLRWGKLPSPIFDTQIAAPMIGLADQIGYAGMVAELLGITLGKGHTRTDWSVRPLSPEQLRYAADDVAYLGTAYQIILDKLQALGRQNWPGADVNSLLDPELYANSPEHAWHRLSAARHLRGRALTTLKRLAAWREQLAQELDTPRSWIIKDDVLGDLAREAPITLQQLKQMRGIDERIVKRHGEDLCEVIAAASLGKPEDPGSNAPAGKRDPAREALLDLLVGRIRERAAENALSPALLASRRDLELLLDDPGSSRLMQGWRQSLLAQDLVEIMTRQGHWNSEPPPPASTDSSSA